MKTMMRMAAGTLLALALSGFLRAEEDPDYTKGVFVLNEDWFGHHNGTVNYLRPDGEWEYRVFQKENPGKELGCTTQYGAIFNGRMYIVAKQARDNGATVTGGRITVCDAATMKCLKQIENIATDENGQSVADGRAFVGVDERKGYVSTSNGIYVFDLEKMEVGGMIAGTGSGDGGLYSAQCGTMIKYGKYVFAVHQQKGLLVIDAGADTVMRIVGAPVEEVNGKTLQRGYGSIVQAKDSSMWLSVAADLTGRGNTVDYFMRFDPKTLDTLRIVLPEGCGLPNSWYAWTADAFCASMRQNRLYWKKQSGGWFTNSLICCYDIDKNECTDFFDTREIGWYIYCGAGFRVHPQTDEVYVSLYKENLSQEYELLRLSPDGEVLAEYGMIDNYWFPAMLVFPAQAEDPDDPVSNEPLQSSVVKNLYPNPTAGAVNVELLEPATVEVFALDGRLLHRQKAEAGIHTLRLERSGLYVLRVTSTKHTEIRRIVRR